ncbi:glycosyl hydrolase [Lactiplantibacillus fabifermentans T30PCM01]|uniref:Glycosyl hydrolase n=1 Tax=Lactiplantibacillus fabifermentans T30PCM01 TaxID=1400520 RepID=W6T400_9LACO|nr:beta-L-arabinofuranosidase domain-containing protein [Lactiplantibacillus fabifermentans]ETY72696.1 glycosyl hydrolase [Lactiplantibacillus fabifermentans T30PCM01]
MEAKQITIDDSFWNYYRDLVKNVMIPYQWGVLNDEIEITASETTSYYAKEKSHALRNLRIVAGQERGHFHGQWFQDSDVYKWLEAAAYVLGYATDASLTSKVNQVVDLIGQAQQADGYLDTYFQLVEPDRKLKHIAKSHELYCMGHYIEAGCAVYQVLGNTKALKIAIKMADFIDAHFGPEPEKLHGYPGHPEIELALMKLADITKESRYLNLAKYMIDTRGTQPNFFSQQLKSTAIKEEAYWGGSEPDLGYFQADVPVREIKMAEGHAVRMVYLLTGMAHVARKTHDQSLIAACERLYQDIVNRQMYVTGGVGATANGEAFTFDYDLPNDTAYAETCAACGMVFFTKQMLENHAESRYADIMERELFNSTLSGMALDGQHFFYVNPLEVDPVACKLDPNKHHVLPTRPKWLACACCPPNLARLLSSLDQYIYTVNEKTLYVNQFIGSQITLDNGVKLTQSGNYPWSGEITFNIEANEATVVNIGIRIPDWCHGDYKLTNDGELLPFVMENGYAMLKMTVKQSMEWQLSITIRPQQVRANPLVRADIDKVAIQNGPLIYCLEQTDNCEHLPWLTLASTAQFTRTMDDTDFSIPIARLSTTGQQRSTVKNGHAKPINLDFIPYFAWGNREVGEMLVWMDQQA